MIKIVDGCLLQALKDGHVQSIAHCSNCFCSFGPVVAALIRKEFPIAYAADLQTERGDGNKLGTFTYAEVLPNRFVFNLYGQYKYGPRGPQYLNYEAFENGLEKILNFCDTHNIKSLGMPYKIGCNLAGGDWTVVEDIITKVSSNKEATVLIYKI